MTISELSIVSLDQPTYPIAAAGSTATYAHLLVHGRGILWFEGGSRSRSTTQRVLDAQVGLLQFCSLISVLLAPVYKAALTYFWSDSKTW